MEGFWDLSQGFQTDWILVSSWLMGVGEIETPTGQRKEPGPKSALGRLRDLILRRTRENWEWYFALRIVYDSGVPLNTKL